MKSIEYSGGAPMHNGNESGITENFKREVIDTISQKKFKGKHPLGSGFFIIKKREYNEEDGMIIDSLTVEKEDFLILSNLG